MEHSFNNSLFGIVKTDDLKCSLPRHYILMKALTDNTVQSGFSLQCYLMARANA